MTRVPRTPRAERLFARLLALYPRAFRERFGDDMRELFRDQLGASRRAGGGAAVARLWLRTIPALASAALLERRDARRVRADRARHDSSSRPRSDGMLATFRTDLRFAGRMLRKSPAFTAIAVLVVSLGSGAVTTIYSAMNAMLLRPMAGAADPSRLVRLERVKGDGSDGILGASYPYYEHVRDGARAVDVLAWSKVALTVSTRDAGTAVYGNLVSANFFATLGVRPLLGRFFAPDEARAEMAAPVIVVSEAFWRARLGGDSAAVGRPITVNGHAYTLVGVAPRAFGGLDAPIRTDAWVPLAMTAQLRPRTELRNASAQWLRLAGRRAPRATPEAARAELVALGKAYAASGLEPEWGREFDDVRVAPLSGLPSDASRALGGFLALLLGAATLVLLIASVNVASMLSARAVARRREMAVRAALGASRGRLVRQLLTEVLALFALGAIGGVVLTAAATAALERMRMPSGGGNVSIALELSPDLRVTAFALLVSLAAGIAFGLAPALQGVRRDVTARLRADTAGGGRRSRAGNALVVGQLAMSLLLLVAAGLFLRALDRGRQVHPGFDSAGVSVARFDAESWGYDDAKGRAFYAALRERVAAIPGVAAVAYTEHVPLTMHSSGDAVEIAGATGPDRKRPNALPVSFSHVGEDYFATIRLPVARGRPFRPTDDERAPKVAVVNETLALRYWPDGSAVGRTFRYQDAEVTIVGVARDAKYASLDEVTPPMVYLPLAQRWRAGRALLVRAVPGAGDVSAALREAVRALDPALPHPTVRTLAEENAIVLLPQRVAAIVTGSLGAVGLLLASVGLYGIIAYSVSRRSREIGIRVAIGARRADVLAMVLRDGMRLAGFGVVIGLTLGVAATRLIRGFLFDVSPLDAAAFGGMSTLFVVVALVASWIPARRAAAADPRVVLVAE